MRNFKFYDISLYGHITLDNIFDGEKYDSSIGSIGNVWRSLKEINSNLTINLQPTEFGSAKISIDRINSSRSSKANLSQYILKPKIYKSKWHHILYLNELKDYEFLKKIKSGLISVDFCAGKNLINKEILSYVDFIFISDEDIFMDLCEMSKISKKGVILHSSSGSEFYSSGEILYKNVVDKIYNINVLGCGDRFAACFINNYIETGDIDKSIKKSHQLLSKYLNKLKIDN